MIDNLPNDVQDFLLDQAYAEGTREIYSRMLCDYLDYAGGLSAAAITKKMIRRWLNSHDTWSNTTKWLGYSALRAYARYAYGDHHSSLDLSIKRGDSPPQKTLTVDQARALYQYLKDKADRSGRWASKWSRDLAIYSLFLDTGLRSFELCSLNMSSIDTDTRTVKARCKGGNWGVAIFSDQSLINLVDWFKQREVVTADPDPVFVGIGGITPGKRITTDGLRVIIRRWGKAVGLSKLSPHVFRRSFATLSTINGAPTRMVQLAGRWSSVQEVERYTRSLTLQHFDEYLPIRAIS